MDNVVRKISIGSDYKNDAMHYSVGQEVYGGHEISHILFEEKDLSDGQAYPAPPAEDARYAFNSNMAISIEYDLQY